jgi:hypothetical protein
MPIPKKADIIPGEQLNRLNLGNCDETVTIKSTGTTQTRQTLEIHSDPPLTNRGKVLLDSRHTPQLSFA